LSKDLLTTYNFWEIGIWWYIYALMK